MSEYKVPYTTILDIQPHNNAERLEVATIYGFQVVIQKSRYKIGDKIVYVPVDSILNNVELENLLFPVDSKVKLHNSRIRQIRLRGLASQGMVIDPKDLSAFLNLDYIKLEEDLSAMLNITKYEPPQLGFAQTVGKDKRRNRKYEHPMFHKYNGLDNVKWFPDLFKEGELVVIQEKLHGTNARASVLPFYANTTWKKLLKFFRLSSSVEHCYGSNMVQKSHATNKKNFYDEDVWGLTFKSIDVFSKLKLGETVFGEIIGPGIQKNYEYGLKEHKFILFDVKILQEDGKQKWLSPKEVEAFAKERQFDYVPVMYEGPYNKELTYSLTKGNSKYANSQKVIEGVVIKAMDEYNIEGNKKALKWISEAYLDDKSNTDFH